MSYPEIMLPQQIRQGCRDAGDGDIVELNVILKGTDGTSKNFPQDFRTTGFNTHESKRFEITYLGSGISQLAGISLSATIKNQDGKELKGSPVLAYTVTGNEKLAGMVLWLDFENGIVDKSNNGNIGALGGSGASIVDLTSGNRRSKVLNLIGPTAPGSYLSIPDKDSLDFGTGSFTIIFWTSNVGGQVSSPLPKVVDKYASGRGYSVNIYASSGTAQKIMPYLSSDSSTFSQPEFPADKNSWWCYALVIDRTSTPKKITSYKHDGVSATQITAQIPSSTGSDVIPANMGDISNSVSLTIGSNNAHDSNRFIGQLDDIAIYNRALSAEDIKKFCIATKNY